MTSDLIVCNQCAGINRIPVGRRAEDAKCGKCGAKLFNGRPDDVDT